jgi:hypothetical protein
MVDQGCPCQTAAYVNLRYLSCLSCALGLVSSHMTSVNNGQAEHTLEPVDNLFEVESRVERLQS